MIWRIFSLFRLQNIFKCVFWKKSQESDWTPFAEDIRCVLNGSHQSSQQNPGIEMRLSWKYPWRSLLSYGMDPLDIHRIPHIFWEKCYPTKIAASFPWRQQRKDKMKEGCQTFGILQVGNRVIELLIAANMWHTSRNTKNSIKNWIWHHINEYMNKWLKKENNNSEDKDTAIEAESREGKA